MKGDFEYYERIRKLPGIVTDYLNGLTCKQISEKTGLDANTIAGYLKNKEAINEIYGAKASEVVKAIEERKAINRRSTVTMININRIVSQEKGKSR